MNQLSQIRPAEELSEAARLVAQGLRRSALAPVWLACIAICLDVPILSVALWFAQYAVTPTESFGAIRAALAGTAIALAGSVFLAVTNGYDPRILRHPLPAIARTLAGLTLPAAILSVLAAPEAAPTIFAAAVLALLAAVVPSRIGAAFGCRWLVDQHLLDRRAVIAGGGEHADRLIRGLAARKDSDIRLYGIFDDRDDVRSPLQSLGVPKIGGYDDLINFARISEIDMVIIALPLEAEARIQWLLEAFRVLPVEVRLSAFSRDYAFASPERDPLISAMRRSFAPERRLTKRAFDILVASVALVLLAPVMGAAALAIRLESRGPVLFRQRRHGYNDRIVEVLKFRSMYHEMADPEAQKVVSRGDPRVTRVGRFLRRSSIDELPQLINVLKGDLSLVGPRPHAIDAMGSDQRRFSRMVEGYSARHRLPPGITGWAQIHGWRGEIDDPAKLAARFEHDLYYIENWSLWLDIRILLRTPLSLLDTRSAY